MKAAKNSFHTLTAASVPRARPIRVFALSLGLVALFLFSMTVLPNKGIRPLRTVEAAGYSPWLYLDCVVSEVSEGDEFRLVVRTKYDTNAFSKPMSVYWYTDAGTADESDYERLYAEGQVSNGHQSRTGKMGRTFFTYEDSYPEIDETYTVRFNNSVDYGTDGSCPMTILDDDGVGIYDLEIRSIPRDLPSAQQEEGPRAAYTTGDVILVTARFNHPVTVVNPATGEHTDYAGLYLQVGENRRVANVVRGDGTDTLIFGYTVESDDVDLDGISVEDGGAGTGLYYNAETRNSGLWPVNPKDGKLNRLFHGLGNDAEHPVVQVDVGDPTIIPPTDDDTPVDSPPGEWVVKSQSIEPNLLARVDGELTEEDGGRDWYGFQAMCGEDYIIELTNKMDISLGEDGLHLAYVSGHLVDPSILEIVDVDGVKALDEHDDGGFVGFFARAVFTPEDEGMYYIAVGAGKEDRGGLGLYTLSVRRDDHPDDFRTRPGVALRPGATITACIDSDVSPNDPGLNPWDWWEIGDSARPIVGLQSLDDMDVIRFEIAEEGTYRLSVDNGPDTVGVWAIFDELGNTVFDFGSGPVATVDQHLQPGNYAVSGGNVVREPRQHRIVRGLSRGSDRLRLSPDHTARMIRMAGIAPQGRCYQVEGPASEIARGGTPPRACVQV